jgi:hypothetical protein
MAAELERRQERADLEIEAIAAIPQVFIGRVFAAFLFFILSPKLHMSQCLRLYMRLCPSMDITNSIAL